MYNRNMVGDQLMREYVFEKTRAALFPDKPSRLDCIFACRTQREAEDYLRNTGQNTQIIYEVEVLSPSASIHIGDYSKVSPIDNYFDNIESCAVEYWKTKEAQSPEVIVGSNVKILRRLI